MFAITLHCFLKRFRSDGIQYYKHFTKIDEKDRY